MPEFFQQPKFEGNIHDVQKASDAADRVYRPRIHHRKRLGKLSEENGTVCGITLPEGLKESDKLPEPIYTPSTKAEIGDHDENISFEQSIAHLEKYFPGKGQEICRASS